MEKNKKLVYITRDGRSIFMILGKDSDKIQTLNIVQNPNYDLDR